MNRGKKKGLAGLVFGMILILAAGGFAFRSKAEKAKLIGCDVQAKYTLGENLVLPTGQVSYKGEKKPATSVYLVYPSGKANNGETVTLSEEGQYRIVYHADFDGKEMTAEKTFMVDKSLLSVSSEKSTAEIKNKQIHIALASEDVFTYNKALDLSEATKETSLINMEMNPQTVGTADAMKVKIRFTDLYDPENYLTLTIQQTSTDDWAESQCYILAGAANQSQVGVENLEDVTKTNIHKNDVFGAPVYFSLRGKPISSIASKLNISFDYEQKILYADREIYSGGQNRMIVDLDDSAYFGTDLWNGFTTGEVKMTIWAENYQASQCHMILNILNGESDFSAKGDDEAPQISVNTGYDEADLPHALVGKAFPLYEARAFDKYDGETEVTASAYYKYYSENPIKLAVKDGCFTPEKEGVYTLEYRSTDESGNIATECVKVYAKKGDGLKIKLKDALTETTTGSTVRVLKDIAASDASGRVQYEIVAKHAQQEEPVSIPVKTKEFTPMRDGNWEITVTAKDYVQTVTQTFNIKADHTSQPQVYEEAAVQHYFILGATYTLPTLTAYDFSSGTGEEKAMSVYVKEKKENETELKDGVYVPTKAGEVNVIYRLTVDGKSCEKVYTAKVIDTGYQGDLDLSSYFTVTKGSVKVSKEATNVTYTADQAAQLEFVNFVQVKRLEFSFMIGQKNNFGRLNFYLTDTLTGKQVRLSYRKTAGGTKFSVNGGIELDVASSFVAKDRNFSLTYANDTHMVSAADGTNVKIDTFTDGSAFTGFTDSVAFFAVEIEDVKGTSQFVVNNLNGQSLNNTRIDRFAPQVLVETKSGDRGLDEEITLPGAFVYDTLDPVSSLTLTVTDPKGKAVQTKDGVSLDGTQDVTKDVTFCLTQYGDYTIRYYAEDGKGKVNEYVYAVTAKDTVAPEVTIKRHKNSAKVGAEVLTAETETKDNVSGKCTVNVYVYDPNGVRVQVEDGRFEATKQGVYTVRYMVSDESGNYTFASYEVDVKE